MKKRIRVSESQLYGLIRHSINEAYSIEGNVFDGLSRKYVSDIKGSYKNYSYKTLVKEIAKSVCDLALRGGKRNAIRYGNDYYANEVTIELEFDDVDFLFEVYVEFTYLMDGNLPYDIHILEIDAYPELDIDTDETSEEEDKFHDAVRDYILSNLSVDAIQREVQAFLAKAERRRRMTNPTESIVHRVVENVMRKLNEGWHAPDIFSYYQPDSYEDVVDYYAHGRLNGFEEEKVYDDLMECLKMVLSPEDIKMYIEDIYDDECLEDYGRPKEDYKTLDDLLTVCDAKTILQYIDSYDINKAYKNMVDIYDYPLFQRNLW